MALRDSNNAYPVVNGIDELRELVGEDLPTHDRWGTPYFVRSTRDSFVIVSHGKGGILDSGTPLALQGAMTRYEDDIAMKDGQFVQWPEGAQQ